MLKNIMHLTTRKQRSCLQLRVKSYSKNSQMSKKNRDSRNRAIKMRSKQMTHGAAKVACNVTRCSFATGWYILPACILVVWLINWFRRNHCHLRSAHHVSACLFMSDVNIHKYCPWFTYCYCIASIIPLQQAVQSFLPVTSNSSDVWPVWMLSVLKRNV